MKETDQEAARAIRSDLGLARSALRESINRMTDWTLADHSRDFSSAIAECLSADIALTVADAALAVIEATGVPGA